VTTYTTALTSQRQFTVSLTDDENHELLNLAEQLAATAPRAIDDCKWVDAARRLSVMLPGRLRMTLREYRRDSGEDGALLLRNLPVDPDRLPLTPTVLGSVQREATIPAATLALIALGLGEVVAYREEKSGALVQDVVPVPGMESFQGNAGSTKLEMHVENAFHINRPDYVGLMCLRNDHDNIAGLHLSCVRRALPLLSQETRDILHEPRFVTAAPGSFGGAGGITVPQGILGGSREDPDIRIDFASTEPLDPEAKQAMADLGEAIVRARATIVLEPGDLAFVDNRLTLHGRTRFQPRYDGNDRWLQRVFVHLDARRSRPLRGGDSNVITGNAVK
jgi:Taurine catabolism dioxygenase TauD, TfdA family